MENYNPQEQLKKKLYVARNIEGEPNKDEIRIIRRLEEKLNENPAFIGIAPYGSTMRGYNKKDSDIDIFILFDYSLGDYEKFNTFVSQICSTIEKEEDKEIHFLIKNITLERMLQDIRRNIRNFSDMVVLFINIFTGNKINKYRDILIKEFKTLSDNKKEKIIEYAMCNIKEGSWYASLNSFDKYKFHKITGINNEEINNIKEEREKLWEKRIRNFLGVER